MDNNSEVSDFPDDLTEEQFLLGINQTSTDTSLVKYIMVWGKFYVYKTSIFGDGRFDICQFLNG